MNPWSERIEATRVQFIEGLERLGWRVLSKSILTRDLADGEAAHRITVELTSAFPFGPPRVFPEADLVRSWHRELDGAMCLYPDAGRGTLPWLDAADFVATIERWLGQTRLGWPADAPDMDLERYFTSIDEARLVLYDEKFEHLQNQFVRFTVDGPRIVLAGPGVKPTKASSRKHRLFGYIIDIGEPSVPPQTWPQLMELLDSDVASRLDRAMARGSIDILLVRYSRHGASGAVALLVRLEKSEVILLSVPSASNAHDALTLRSGLDSRDLSGKHVLIVGVGAIGSFICDLLSRAGVGYLTVRDPDILRPGNSIRHLAASRFAGFHKATAVKHIVESRPGNTTIVTAITRSLRMAEEVPNLLAEFDLVIDATADGAASAMLADAAASFGIHILSAALQDEGRIVRADVVPPVRGLPIPVEESKLGDEMPIFEAGCGDPVSMTPPFAVHEAAAIAARLAVQLLLRPSTIAAGVSHRYA